MMADDYENVDVELVDDLERQRFGSATYFTFSDRPFEMGQHFITNAEQGRKPLKHYASLNSRLVYEL